MSQRSTTARQREPSGSAERTIARTRTAADSGEDAPSNTRAHSGLLANAAASFNERSKVRAADEPAMHVSSTRARNPSS
jgi:hypothetical protein